MGRNSSRARNPQANENVVIFDPFEEYVIVPEATRQKWVNPLGFFYVPRCSHDPPPSFSLFVTPGTIRDAKYCWRGELIRPT